MVLVSVTENRGVAVVFVRSGHQQDLVTEKGLLIVAIVFRRIAVVMGLVRAFVTIIAEDFEEDVEDSEEEDEEVMKAEVELVEVM